MITRKMSSFSEESIGISISNMWSRRSVKTDYMDDLVEESSNEIPHDYQHNVSPPVFVAKDKA